VKFQCGACGIVFRDPESLHVHFCEAKLREAEEARREKAMTLTKNRTELEGFFAEIEAGVAADGRITSITVPITIGVHMRTHAFNQAASTDVVFWDLTVEEREKIAKGIWPEGFSEEGA
jgi:hypothetical protein